MGGDFVEVGVAAVVAGFGDKLAGFVEVLAGGGGVGLGEGEAGALKVEVGEVKAHLAAAGDLLDFVQVATGRVEDAPVAVDLGAGEQGPRQVVLGTGGAEAVDGFVEALSGLGKVAQGQGGAAQGQMVQGYRQEREPGC